MEQQSRGPQCCPASRPPEEAAAGPAAVEAPAGASWALPAAWCQTPPCASSPAGIREYARKEGAAFGAVSEKEVEAWLQGGRQGVPSILRDGPSADASATAESSAEAAAEAAHRPGGRRELAAARQEGQPALALPSEWAAGTGGDDGAEGGSGGGGDGPSFSLFAFPAYDNYGGVS